MARPLFSFGISRGGTTFFARILSVNRNVKVASDPFLPLFREFRNQIMKLYVDPKFDSNLPLDDYYYSSIKLQTLDLIQSVGMDLKVAPQAKPALKAALTDRMNLAAKEIAPFAQRMDGHSFRDFFQSGLDLMAEVYGAAKTKWIGSNDNWVIEFLPHLAEAFPSARFIVVIRDPRASMASSLKLRPTDPHLVPLMYSFARHWRKHAAFAWKWKNTPALKNRIFFLRYEDLVSSPQHWAEALCSFLEVDFDPLMMEPSHFRPLEGKKWAAYSHFDISSNKIYTDAIAIWKTFLDPKTIEFIEFVCGPEMQLWGYENQVYQSGESPSSLDFMKEDDRLALGWRGKHASWEEEYVHELKRRALLANDVPMPAQDTVEHFLFSEICEACAHARAPVDRL